MSCVTLTGYTLSCDRASGGVKTVYMVEHSDITSYAQNSAGLVTGITLASGVVLKEYEVQREDSDWTETFAGARENRTVAWDQTLRLKIHKKDAAIRTEILALANFTGAAIVQEEDGGYYFLGADSGLDMTPTTAGQSGINREDMNGWTIELQGKEKLAAPEVDSSIIAGLL